MCSLALLMILVVSGVIIFMKISIWTAVGLTSSIAITIFLLMIMVWMMRQHYIERRMAENGGIPQ